jgi:two-component system phosphate regulon response regulator PhoB
MTGSARALVIEDEADTARLVGFHLRGAGFDVQVAQTGAEGLDMAAAWSPQVIVLDVRLPDTDGFEVCARLRKQPAAAGPLGVLMLTAHGLTEDRIKAFELGADDYLTKPFVVRELILRVTSLARRMAAQGAKPPEPPREPVRCGAIEFDPRTLEVRVSGTLVALRPSELRLLQVFLGRPGAVITRQELLEQVWENLVPAGSRVVDVTMHRLRTALGDHAGAIETVCDGGYRLRRDTDRARLTRR